MNLSIFYTVITVHHLLIFAPHRLQNTQIAIKPIKPIKPSGYPSSGKLLGWARACLPNKEHWAMAILCQTVKGDAELLGLATVRCTHPLYVLKIGYSESLQLGSHRSL
jgi:hypothetical protein